MADYGDGSMLTDGTNLTGTITLSKATGTVVALDTDHKYLDKDIHLTINAPTATPLFSGGTISGGSTAIATNLTLSNSNTTGIQIQTQYSIERTAVTYATDIDGWVTRSSGALILNSATASAMGTTYYVTGLTVPANKSFTVTNNGTLNVTHSNATGTTQVSAKIDENSALIVSTVVENGYWKTTTISQSGTYFGRVVVNKGTITNNTTGGSSTATINRGKQIKIGAGYYNSDVYYTAQSNSGTLTLSASTNACNDISCDGYKYVKINGLTLPNSNSMTVNVTAYSGGSLDTNNVLTVHNNGYRRTVVYNSNNGSTILYNQGGCGIYSQNKTNGSVSVYAYIDNDSTTTTYGNIVSNGMWVSPTVNNAGTYYGRVVIPAATPTFYMAYPSLSASIVGDQLVYNNQAEDTEDGKHIEGIPLGYSVTGSTSNVTYNAAVNGWVKKNSGDIALGEFSIPEITGWTKLKEVILTPPTSSNYVRRLLVTVPNGLNDTITFTFTVDFDGNTTIE